MAGNNAINAVTSSSGWTSFTTTVTATTTNPTQGTGVTKSSYYIQVGKTLFIQFFYSQTGGGAGGSGDYLFNIPPGFTINTTVSPALNTLAVLGSCSLIETVLLGVGTVVIGNSTNYKLLSYKAGSTAVNYASAAWFDMSQAPLRYCVSAQLPIL